jgi:iron-sulfur cluster repair protein YtfE (RIC family)
MSQPHGGIDQPAPDTAADRLAAEAVVRHHAQLSQTLQQYTGRLLAAAEQADRADAPAARADLLAWLHAELVPHALAEEATLYPAAARSPRAALLVDGMLDEHRTITGLVTELDNADSPVRAAAAARALAAVFATHLVKENTLVVPLLVDDDQVSLAGLLSGMHALLGGADSEGEAHGAAGERRANAPDAGNGCGCGGCGCGGGSDRTAGEPVTVTAPSTGGGA